MLQGDCEDHLQLGAEVACWMIHNTLTIMCKRCRAAVLRVVGVRLSRVIKTGHTGTFCGAQSVKIAGHLGHGIPAV